MQNSFAWDQTCVCYFQIRFVWWWF